MISDGLLLLARFNIVAGAAIVVVLALRPFVRRRLGAHQAYLLWLTVPIALVGAIMPPPHAYVGPGLLDHATADAVGWLDVGSRRWIITGVWALGVLVTAAAAAARYAIFVAQARSGRAGPAIMGVITPRLVTPSDFAARFTPEERRLVRAHERAHIDRLDARSNAVVLAMQCVSWFNPLVHLAARAMRFDQELACDATVMIRLPTERRRYAETLLRSHNEAALSPLGCNWSGAGARLLMTRVTTLMQRRPAPERCEVADQLLAALWTCVLAAAWSAQPFNHRPDVDVLVVDLNAPSLQIAPGLAIGAPRHDAGPLASPAERRR